MNESGCRKTRVKQVEKQIKAGERSQKKERGERQGEKRKDQPSGEQRGKE